MTHPSALPSERGLSLSTFIALLMPLLLLTAGLVVDGGARSAAIARAESVAAEAARAGADAGATRQLAGQDPTGDATSAAQRVLDRHQMAGTVHVRDGAVIVTTTAAATTTFLSIIGITELPVEGQAIARLHPS